MKAKLTLVLTLSIFITKAQVANRYDVVIDEIMADPAPPVALPNSEFIELKNVSSRPFNLNGWRIGDVTGFATINSNFILQPDSFVIICPANAVALLSAFGTVLGVSNFPSLDNDGDQLYLRSKEGTTIHAVEYNTAWYRNTLKSQGGWTLEMIDPHNACGGASNWKASNDPKGGTPGKKNSADAANNDRQPPALLNSFATDSITIALVFDEPLDSMAAATVANYTISEGIGAPVSAIVMAPLFNRVQLKTSIPLARNKVYKVRGSNITDCTGNIIGSFNTTMTGWAAEADSLDIVINEILFNPRPGGVDYVELYNRSEKIIDLKDCYIANRSGNYSIGSLRQVSIENRLLFPGTYVLITEDAGITSQHYTISDPGAFAIVASMPSFPNDNGDAVLLNSQGNILDELKYDEKWHFRLLDNLEGISLERIDFNKPTQDAANWHSAATDAGYGTPGYKNSQSVPDSYFPGTIHIAPVIFSPDNDGFDDFTTTSYQFPQPGYVCNITLFDANGRPVRYLTRNALCGLNGYFRWDGLDEKGSKLPIGVYIVYAEVFNLQGKTKRFKSAVTLARRF